MKIRETASLVMGGTAAMLLLIALFCLGANDLTIEGYKFVVGCICSAAVMGYGSWRIA